MTLITEPTKQRIANLFYLSTKKSSKEKFNYDGQADVSPLGSRASLATERVARGLNGEDNDEDSDDEDKTFIVHFCSNSQYVTIILPLRGKTRSLSAMGPLDSLIFY